MKKHEFKIGDIVESHYRSRWTGIVIDIETRKDRNDLITVKLIKSSKGIEIKNKKSVLDSGWLSKVETF